MRLASVHTYPVKSCRRVDHDRSAVRVEPWGLAGDRRWLVVDPDPAKPVASAAAPQLARGPGPGGRCVTQREVAGLARVRPAPRPDGGLVLTASGHPELAVPEPAAGDLVEVSVHGTALFATPAGPAADYWLTTVLERKVRLVWLDDPTRRAVDPAYGEPSDRVSFADAYPLLLANAASLDALNGWLVESGSVEGPLPMTRFRPNVVVAGAAAWAEDGWLGRRLRIGAVTFRVVKSCSRCVVTTTDQESGERGTEPLRILARHRKVGQRLLFGVNLIPDPPYGEIAPGDPVTLMDRE